MYCIFKSHVYIDSVSYIKILGHLGCERKFLKRIESMSNKIPS
jgi:hypothetical protein